MVNLLVNWLWIQAHCTMFLPSPDASSASRGSNISSVCCCCCGRPTWSTPAAWPQELRAASRSASTSLRGTAGTARSGPCSCPPTAACAAVGPASPDTKRNSWRRIILALKWGILRNVLELSLLIAVLITANRETAFVHAISSAGVMYTLTRNCSLGDFDNCGCDDSRNGQRGQRHVQTYVEMTSFIDG